MRGIKPQSGNFPKCAEPSREIEDLPDPSLADKAAMAIAHPVVNITINSMGVKKLQHFAVKVDTLRAWLFRLSLDHDGISQMMKDGKLAISEWALEDLELMEGKEMTRVDDANADECSMNEKMKGFIDEVQNRNDHQQLPEYDDDIDPEGLAAASLQPVFTKQHTFPLSAERIAIT